MQTSRKSKVEKLKAPFRTGPLTSDFQLLNFFVDRVMATRAAEFLQLQPVLVLLLVLRRSVVAVFAVTAL